MFTERTGWDREVNALTRLLRTKRAAGKAICDLTESNPTRCGFSLPDDLLAELSNPANVRYDPRPMGLPPAREAVSSWYKSCGIGIQPGEILLTSGTSEAYSYLFHLLCAPKDTVLIPRPGYPLFDYLGRLHSLRLEDYYLRYDGEWQIDHHSFVDRSARAIILMNPNNPTGSFLRESDVRSLHAACDPSVAFIVDEVFSVFRFDAATERAQFPDDRLVFRLNGLSKMAGLPQLKLAWIAVSGPEPEKTEALRRLEIIADTFLSVASPSQNALPRILEALPRLTEPILARVRHNDAALRESLGPQDCLSVLSCEGGWNAVLRFPGTRTGEDWCLSLLDKCDVLLHPGELFDVGVGSCAIVSLLPDQGVFLEGIQKVIRHVSSGNS